jgi:hypothetical protein
MTTINWKPAKDRIVEGDFANGKSWIKLDKEGKVISMYLKVGDYTEKFFPEDEAELELDFAQLCIEIELEKKLGREKLISKLRV